MKNLNGPGKKYYDIVTKNLGPDMRSLQLIVACFILLFINPLKAANSIVLPDEYFQVVVPYDAVEGKTKQELLETQSSKAMKILLLRLTGQKRLVDSGLGQKYLNQSLGWLANYNIKPRFEDGVAVGKLVQFNFDKKRLQAAFEKQNVNMWSHRVRPSTFIMGAVIQSGRLQKLTDEVLNYRIDVDFRDQLDQLKMPYQLPANTNNWVFPVAPSNSRGIIQEQLLANEKDSLLSFTFSIKAQQNYELEWFLFNTSGVTLNSQVVKGKDRRTLFDNMFSEVMQLYVKQNAVQMVRKDHVLLSLSEVISGNQIDQLLKELQAQQPMVKQAQLFSISKETTVFDIEFQGNPETLLSWLKNWSKISLLSQQGENAYHAVANPYIDSLATDINQEKLEQ